MIELSLLGPHALRGPDGRERGALAAQPKRFALLAYLALARGGFIRRDTLTAVFWPELDQFAARRALRNTLYHLREALGNGVIVAEGDDAVTIDPALLTSDVARLQSAIEAGRYQEAVDTFHGELLAGLHLPNSGESFESWLASERRQIRGDVVRAASLLADRASTNGDSATASYWAQRAAAIAPDDERLMRRAVALLAETGDTGTALRMAEAFVDRLARELQAKPHAETTALIARIRSPRQTITSSVAPAPIAVRPADPVVAPAPIETPAAIHRRTRWPRWFAGAVVVSAVVSAALLVAARHRATLGNARPRVLITVFDNRSGDASLQTLGRMTQDWLTQGMVRTNVVDVVDPRAVYVQSQRTADPIEIAHRTGATLLVSGSYFRSGDSLFLSANLVDAANGRILRTVGPITSSASAPVGGLDALRSRVMTALASVVDRRAAQGLDRTEVPPYNVYQAYVQGWDAFWHGDVVRAESLFLAAAHGDSAFAPAVTAAATSAGNGGNCRLVDSLSGAARSAGAAFAQLDRMTMEIAVAHCHGRSDETLRLALARADLSPSTSGYQLSAAAAALWADRPRRALELMRRIDPRTDLAWSTDTTHFDYWSQLTEALHLLGRHEEELDAANHVPAAAPLSRAWMRGRALAALGRPTAVLALIDSAMALPTEAPNVGLAPYAPGRPEYTETPAWVAVWIARELAVHGDSVAARQAASRAVAWYRGRPADERITPEERLVLAWSLELTGDYAGAAQAARDLVRDDSTNVDAQGMVALLAEDQGDTASSRRTDRWLGAQPAATAGWAANLYRAEVATLRGESDSAMARLRESRDDGAWPLWIHLDPALIPLHHRPDFIALTTPQG